jgi:zinc/manganese transport system permease protein
MVPSRPKRIATMPIGEISLSAMFEYDFMRTAFLAGGIVAVVAGTVGYFLVLRNLTFAGHALSHIGFAGATGSVLLGIAPLWGLLALTLAAAAAIGLLGDRLRDRDVAVGIVLALALGLGVLFLYLYTTSASAATAILFGNLFAVGYGTLRGLLWLSLVDLAALAAISRPLLFASLEPELAEAKGVSLKLVSVLFLTTVAIAVAEAAQVVGVLLVFALMVGPAAAALRLVSRLSCSVALAVALALGETWGGIALAYATDWPPTFWIVSLSCLGYFLSLVKPSA